MKKKIAVVGLGLMGGSLAWALRGFEDYEVIGVLRRQAALELAQERGMADQLTLDTRAAVSQADVVFFCMDPSGILESLETYKNDFKPGALVTDVCGVKTAIMEGAQCLPPEVDFIGCHPMAGIENSGIEYAFKEIYQGCHFILTPRDTSTPEHISLMERIGRYLGARDVVKTTPQEHDAIIAYTSQAMHIVAVSICDDPQLYACRGFEGSSFRGCTRVAALDVDMWTELFTLNAPQLCQIIERLEVELHSYRLAIQFAREHGDATQLKEKLTYSSNRKRRMDLE